MCNRICKKVLLLMACILILLRLCGTSLAQSPPGFKVYSFDFASSADPKPSFGGVAHPATKYRVQKDAGGAQITVEDTGLWRGFFSVGFLGNWTGYAPLFGGERIHLTYSDAQGDSANVPISTGVAIQYYGGQTIDIASGKDMVADGKEHELAFTLPESAAGKHICALWLRIDNPGPGHTVFRVHELSWERRRIDNRLDADKILRTPPPHRARVVIRNGVAEMMVDDQPITGLGWNSILMQNVSEPEVQDMDGKTGFQLARVIFTLGEHLPLQYYPASWLGPEQYDFSYLDQQVGRVLRANPNTKMLLQVALDGAKWWMWLHPNAGGTDGKDGYPDYPSPEWRRDSREAIRQMVAHVQSSPYAGAVIGYQLMNGPTEDCTFDVNVTTPPAIRRFQSYLRDKYKTDAALQAAWNSPSATLNTVTGEITKAEHESGYAAEGLFPLLMEPARCPALMDKIAYHEHVYQQTILNFARDIKEATQGRALVGARVGDFMGNIWNWFYLLPVQQYPIDELLDSPDFDYFEVQEPYIGRGIADYGSGVPVLLPQGTAAHHKVILIQNDVRTHLSAPNAGFGRTPNLPSTLTVQRRIFVNALALGTYPYLWQQAYHYNDPEMLADFRKQEAIYRRALDLDRSTDAEIAFVFDVHYRKYFGYDPIMTGPSRGTSLFDYLKFTWARAGVPFDMIFLDQLPTAKPYKVYVFVDTVGLSDDQRSMIRSVVRRDRRVGVFLWGDGLIDGRQANVKKMSELIGIDVAQSPRPATWKMTPTRRFRDATHVEGAYPMGTLAINEPADSNAPQTPFSPSFIVKDRQAESLAVFAGGQPNAGAVGIAMKQTPEWTTLYSASAILPPPLLRYIVKLAGGHTYTDTEDACYINRSFIGFHAKQTHTIHVTLPEPSPLYDLFNDRELPRSATFEIPVEIGQTYLFFRGDKQTWQQVRQ